MRRPPALTLSVVVLLAGCARSLPDQDRRIYATRPVAKLSADVLWQDYEADRAAADRQYWGKALEVSGTVTEVGDSDGRTMLVFAQGDAPGVRAALLDDEAEAIVGRAAPGQRITLRCFCAGFDGAVQLKSCIGTR